MDNTGELKLNMPALPDLEWSWRVDIEKPGITSIAGQAIVFSLTRSIWYDKQNKAHHGEVWNSMPVAMQWRSYEGRFIYREYDEIIRDAQQAVDDLFDRWTHRDVEIKTGEDALVHIVQTVQSTPGVTNSLHFEE